jgi:hypothetical protein
LARAAYGLAEFENKVENDDELDAGAIRRPSLGLRAGARATAPSF